LQEVKEKYPDTVKILFTGYTDFSAAEEAINVGEVYRFISKPWKTMELLSTIRQSIEHYDLVTFAKVHE
jgi:YesN/AraC family two-component response regulator